MHEHVYDPLEQQIAIEEYENISHEAKCFDLALLALIKEVEARFNDKLVKNEDRLAFTRELDLCLQREKKRCQKELSDNKLPVFSKRNDLLEALMCHDAVIVVAQTGSGKSTQIPQYLADDLHHVLSTDTKFPKIACTQPRRVAAVRIAQRVSLEYAGAIDVENIAQVKRNMPVSNITIAAYPLYASLSQEDQDRALDEEDRVGSHKPYNKPKDKLEKTKGVSKSDSHISQQLLGTPGEVGGWVGFHIGTKGKSEEERKKCKKICSKTRIEFVTEGLLLQTLKHNSKLSHYQCVVVDEAHERGRDTDLLLAHLHNLIKKSKTKGESSTTSENLKVVVMSASINQKAFSDYFGGCPIIECKGRMFDVKEIYLPRQGKNKMSEYSRNNYACSDKDSSGTDTDSTDDEENEKDQAPIVTHVVEVLFNEIVSHKEPGDVLVFLPGQREIHACVNLINKKAEEERQNLNSNGNLFNNVRKVVCCTNIAETSLTIPGVRFVLDAGKAKKIFYDHKLRVSALKLQDTSQASAKQRKGRAGRVQTGWCYRLYSEKHFHENMHKYDEPEMKQCAIDELYLYTLDVFGSLESIELMPDAQPREDTIQSARERLLNFGFVEEVTDSESSIKITEDGKFALMISGDLSLEGARMVLAAQNFGIVEDALALAVLLQVDIFTKIPVKNENRMILIEELGDHMTLINLYKHFEKKITGNASKVEKEERAQRWCEDCGISFEILQQVRKSIDSVYQTLKRNEKYGSIKESSRGEKKNKQSQVYSTSLVEKKEELLKVIITGYFHNIAELHDVNYIKAGYSLITPAKYGEKFTGPCDVDLLKVKLFHNSSLLTHGDNTKNTYTVFGTLFKSQRGHVFMKNVSKIKTEWIHGWSSQRWQKSVGLQFNAGDMTSYVTIYRIPHVGPAVLASMLREQDCGKRFIEHVEERSNAKVGLLFDTAEVKCYGSLKETATATTAIKDYRKEVIKEYKENDKVVSYTCQNEESPICDVEFGFKVCAIHRQFEAIQIEDWDLIQSATLIFLKAPPNPNEIIKKTLNKLKNVMPYELQKIYEDPEVRSYGSLTKVHFHCQKIANHIEKALQLSNLRIFGFPLDTRCFLDQEIQIRVWNTRLYPSVIRLSEAYEFVEVQEIKERAFKIKKRKGAPRSAQYQINEFMEAIQEKKVFGSCVIEYLHLSLPNGIKEFIYRQLVKHIQQIEYESTEIKNRKYPTPCIEVFGEYLQRLSVANNLKLYIRELKEDIESNAQITRTYHNKLNIGRNQLSSVLYHICRLREKHNNVTFSMLGGGDHSFSSNLAQPVVQLLSDSYRDGENAAADMTAAIKELLPSNDFVSCAMCRQEVHLPATAKEKKEERKLLKFECEEKRDKKKQIRTENHRNLIEARRLTLCGCVYCTSCLHEIIYSQLQEHSALFKHDRVVCLQCHEVVLMRDVVRLSGKSRDKLYHHALRNYLLHKTKESRDKWVVDKCFGCKTLMLRCSSGKGIYRCINDRCRNIYCVRCGARVLNKMDFEQHQNC